MKDKELKPCPFCGKTAQIEDDGHSHEVIGCTDIDCLGAEMGFYYLRDDYKEKINLINQWNTRTSDKVIEELKDTLTKWYESDFTDPMVNISELKTQSWKVLGKLNKE